MVTSRAQVERESPHTISNRVTIFWEQEQHVAVRQRVRASPPLLLDADSFTYATTMRHRVAECSEIADRILERALTLPLTAEVWPDGVDLGNLLEVSQVRRGKQVA